MDVEQVFWYSKLVTIFARFRIFCGILWHTWLTYKYICVQDQCQLVKNWVKIYNSLKSIRPLNGGTDNGRCYDTKWTWWWKWLRYIRKSENKITNLIKIVNRVFCNIRIIFIYYYICCILHTMFHCTFCICVERKLIFDEKHSANVFQHQFKNQFSPFH